MRIVFCLFVFAFGVSSSAMTSQQVARSYQNCMRFLRMSPAQQQKSIQKSGYSLSQVRWACRVQQRTGLAQLQANERHRLRGGARSGGVSSSSGSEPTYGGECFRGSGSINCTEHGPGSLWDKSGCNATPGSFECSGR